jgi:hypothetical protein
VTTAAGSSAAYAFGVGSQPGLFTLSGEGCGQAAALNIRADGSVSVNSASNSAAPGDYVALFGTGLGFSSTQPADGAGATGPAPIETASGLMLDESLTPMLAYAGLAPTLPGVDQINFRVPAATRNGCAVPVSASAGLFSPEVTIAVQKGGGQCVDPPVQSYGTIMLTESTFTSSAAGSAPSTQDSFIASFPAAPGLPAPAPEKILFAPDYIADTALASAVYVQAPVFDTGEMRVCDVPGYTHLSAGPITIQPPSGAAIIAQPVAVNPQAPGKGMFYAQALPGGSMGAGKYTITGAQLSTSIQVGSPIQLQTSWVSSQRQFPATISSSQPLTVKWTGGDSSSLVRFSLCSTDSVQGTLCDYSYAHTSDGSLTVSPLCTGHSVSSGGNGVFCSWGLPLSTNAQIVIDVLPSASQTIAVSGVTGLVTVSWRYRYTFAGLTLGS